MVGRYWGEARGRSRHFAAAGAGLLILVVQLMLPRPLWHRAGDGLAHALLVLGVAGALATGTTSYYMGERFSTVSQDLEGRIGHWQERYRSGAHLRRSLAGLGLRRYPRPISGPPLPTPVHGVAR